MISEVSKEFYDLPDLFAPGGGVSNLSEWTKSSTVTDPREAIDRALSQGLDSGSLPRPKSVIGGDLYRAIRKRIQSLGAR